jgi:carboxypeptidase D
MFAKWLSILALGAVVTSQVADAQRMTKAELHRRQAEAAKKFQRRAAPANAGPKIKNITFSNPKASRKSSSAFIFILF